jgi:hypothetical protein
MSATIPELSRNSPAPRRGGNSSRAGVAATPTSRPTGTPALSATHDRLVRELVRQLERPGSYQVRRRLLLEIGVELSRVDLGQLAKVQARGRL